MPAHEQPTRKRRYRIVPGRPPVRPAAPSEDLDQIARGVFGKPRHELIEEAAYYRSLGRAEASEDPDGDWLAAEREIDALLRESRIF